MALTYGTNRAPFSAPQDTNDDSDDTMTPAEFRQWIADMNYPKKSKITYRDRIEYDPVPIMGDLGIGETRLMEYWRGIIGGKPVRLNRTVSRLCKTLMTIHQTKKLIVSIQRQNPALSAILTDISSSLDVQLSGEISPRKRRNLTNPDEKAEVEKLRNRAMQLRKTASLTATVRTRYELISEAEGLENRASEIEILSRKSSPKTSVVVPKDSDRSEDSVGTSD